MLLSYLFPLAVTTGMQKWFGYLNGEFLQAILKKAINEVWYKRFGVFSLRSEAVEFST